MVSHDRVAGAFRSTRGPDAGAVAIHWLAARGEPMRATPGMFDPFAALSGALGQAAAAIARLDALLNQASARGTRCHCR